MPEQSLVLLLGHPENHWRKASLSHIAQVGHVLLHLPLLHRTVLVTDR